jgi:hypothetical protein
MQLASSTQRVTVHADVVSAVGQPSSASGTMGVRPGWQCTLDANVPDTGEYFDDDDEGEEAGAGAGDGTPRDPRVRCGRPGSAGGGGGSGEMDYSYMGARAAVAKYLTGSM